MIGTFFTSWECELLIPLLIKKLDSLESFSTVGSESEKMLLMKERDNYREILGKIFVSLEISESKKC